MALYGDELWEAVPDRQGSFAFPAAEGAYLLLFVADVEKGSRHNRFPAGSHPPG